LNYFAWGDRGWLDEFAGGLSVTVALACASYILGLAAGILGAAAALSRFRVPRGIAVAYTVLGRCVPELLLIILIFYGGNQAVQALLRMAGVARAVEMGAFTAGVIALSFVVGAAATSIIRGALLAIDPGQLEAALTIGLSKTRIFLLITLPQAIRLALPGLGNVWIGLLKETALVSVIGLTDILRVARIASGATHEPLPFLLATGAIYLALTAISIFTIRALAKHLRISTREIGHAH
jgi:octopine/nopaline transport system permease protein